MRAAPVRVLLLLALYLSCACAVSAQNLKVRVEGTQLRVSGSAVHFLTGRALDRLRNGATVTYAISLSLKGERSGRILTRVTERFVVSYDLWEEKFLVTRQGSPTRSASNLKAGAAEAWCIENLALSVENISKDRQVWVALEFALEEPGDSERPEASGLSLGSLIEIFSKRQRDEQVRGSDEIGPIRIGDLRKK